MGSEIFLSYTGIKDLYGAASNFHEHLEHEVRMKSGNTEISIFQDKKNLRFGENFKDALADELATVKIFVILLSPTWLKSDWCKWEYQEYLKHGQNSIIVVKWDDINGVSLNTEEKQIYNDLKQLHVVDWLDLKYADWKSKDENIAAAELAIQIADKLNQS